MKDCRSCEYGDGSYDTMAVCIYIRNCSSYSMWEPKPMEEPMEKSTELKVKTSRVLEAAKTCPDTKRVLEKLFPEAFEEEDLSFDIQDFKIYSHVPSIVARTAGKYKGKAFCLDPDCNWELILEDDCIPVLIPTKRPTT